MHHVGTSELSRTFPLDLHTILHAGDSNSSVFFLFLLWLTELLKSDTLALVNEFGIVHRYPGCISSRVKAWPMVQKSV